MGGGCLRTSSRRVSTTGATSSGDGLTVTRLVDPTDLLSRVAELEDIVAQVERLGQSVSLGALDLEPLLLDALDRVEAVTAELREALA